MITQQDREILRQTVVGYLATRQQLEFEASAIRRSIVSRQKIDFAAADEDVIQALEFLQGLGFVEHHTSEIGATVYWKATSNGVLESERKGWNV